MSKVRRIDYYPDEYIVQASRLSFEQQGAYWLVCSLIMSHGGPIDADYRRIGRLGGVTAAKAKKLIDGLVEMAVIERADGKIAISRGVS